MDGKVIVYKSRTTVVKFNLGMDVSANSITSQIRSEPDQDAPIITSWLVTKPNGGSDGLIYLTLSYLLSRVITDTSGWMDIKRIVSGEPVPVLPRPLEVEFRGAVTV